MSNDNTPRSWDRPQGASFKEWMETRVARFSSRRFGNDVDGVAAGLGGAHAAFERRVTVPDDLVRHGIGRKLTRLHGLGHHAAQASLEVAHDGGRDVRARCTDHFDGVAERGGIRDGRAGSDD